MRRVSDQGTFGRPIIVTNSQYRFLVAEQLAELGVEADIVLEPVRRDSGPAIIAGSAFACNRDGDAIVVALAADQVIDGGDSFAEICRNARSAAEAARVVLFGVRPTRPATEYGYIGPGEQISPNLFAIDRFVEKPDAATAAHYLKEGYLWNSGNFLFSARFLIEEYRQYEPDSAEAVLKAVDAASTDLGFTALQRDHFGRAAAKSIDYAVIERTHHAAVTPADFNWSDVGSWHAVWELSKPDAQGNSARGAALFVDARNSYVSTDKQFVALHGVDDVAVIATDDAILITRRDGGGGLRHVVEQVKSVAPKLTEEHSTVGRPWGTYQSVDQGDRFQVKRIVVKKGGRLSLQLHHHRSEHWVVVRGTARVTVGDKVMSLHENESVYVPSGAKHRLENPGKIDLELIEVQTGSYLGEDDIVRIEDDYKRS